MERPHPDFEARGPHPLFVKLRDKFAPRVTLQLKTTDGVLPYARSDLVATSLAAGTFERGELAAITRVLPYCRGMVDVGANLGLYTLLAAQRLSTGGRVVAFEASPIEFAKLKWTVRRNDLQNVEPVWSAVSDAVGEATIYQSTAGAGALNRLDGPAKHNGNWVAAQVPMTSVDAWFQKAPAIAIDLLKIDVEGHELPVLSGAARLLQREKPVVLIEINAARSSSRSDPARIWSFMLDHDYEWYGLDDDGRVSPVHEPGTVTNLFAVPKSPKHAAVVHTLLGQ